MQLLCCRVGANKFETLNDAYAAVAQAAASIDVMVVKAGAKKTQKLTPFKVMSPPFEEVVLVDGFYPQMSMRIRCDRLHDPTYESVCKYGKQSGLVPVDERRGVFKGVPSCLALQLASCRHSTCGFLGAKCSWEIAVWTDGLKAYVHVPDACHARASVDMTSFGSFFFGFSAEGFAILACTSAINASFSAS